MRPDCRRSSRGRAAIAAANRPARSAASAYCADCADEIIAEIRGRILARDGLGVGVIAGHREPDLGPHIWQLACSVCQATWSGRNGDPCPWCVAAAERQRLEQRRLLLYPDWLHEDGPRYDDLSDVDTAVWDRTRCQVRGAGSIEAWAERLARSVQSELITRRRPVQRWRGPRGRAMSSDPKESSTTPSAE